LFTISCLVVLLSVVLHGGGMAIFLRRQSKRAAAQPSQVSEQVGTPSTAPAAPAMAATTPPVRRTLLPVADESPADANEEAANKITLDEFRALRKRGEEVILVDARADRNYRKSDIQAAGSVRLNPEDPVRDATKLRLSQRATLVVYCA
jgi:rhodanese-related sulfurtransferase